MSDVAAVEWQTIVACALIADAVGGGVMLAYLYWRDG
jgi:hypothetical protein